VIISITKTEIASRHRQNEIRHKRQSIKRKSR
jgi:hypothetical protein